MLKVAKTLELKDAQETESAAILGEEHPELKKKKGNPCESLIWGNKKNSKFVTCSFRKRVIEIAESLAIGKDKIEGANWLMAVMALESIGTFDPTAGTFVKKGYGDESESGYVGLIQFGYWAALDIKVKRSELAKMTALEQLDSVEKYFKLPQFKGKLKTMTDLYLAVLYQSACGHGSEKDYVVFDSKSSNSTNKKAYWDNPTFHHQDGERKINSKGERYENKGMAGGKTYVWEVMMEIKSWYSRGLGKRNKCKTDASTCEFGSSVGKSKKVKEGYDIDKAVAYLVGHVEPKSISQCALYVRRAINAGGIEGSFGHAYQYHDQDVLVGLGFKNIGNNIDSIVLEKGDIIAFPSVEGHKWGHIAMYDGTQFISDFKQKSMWVANEYKVVNKYKVYRWK
jgi:hypothetical protein